MWFILQNYCFFDIETIMIALSHISLYIGQTIVWQKLINNLVKEIKKEREKIF